MNLKSRIEKLESKWPSCAECSTPAQIVIYKEGVDPTPTLPPINCPQCGRKIDHIRAIVFMPENSRDAA